MTGAGGIDLENVRIRSVGPPPEGVTDEHLDAMNRVLFAALAEAGYPREMGETFGAWRSTPVVPPVPWAVLNKARLLVLERFGIDYKLVPVDS